VVCTYFLENAVKHSKHIAASLALSASVILSAIDVKAQENSAEPKLESKSMPKRRIDVPVFSNSNWANPSDSFDANTQDWHSVNQLLGKANDFCGITLGLDDYLLGRIGLFAFGSALLLPPNYFSHELAHSYYSRWNGKDAFDVSFGFFKNTVEPINFGRHVGYVTSSGAYGIEEFGLGFMRVSNTTDASLFKNKNDLSAYTFNNVAGLNQQELNVAYLHEQFAKENKIFFDQSVNFILNRFFTLGYVAFGNSLPVEKVEDLYALSAVSDSAGYRAGLKLKGHNISQDNLLLESIIPVVLSFDTFNSFKSIENYLGGDRRTTTPKSISLGSCDLLFPLVSHYFTPDGGFYNATLFLNPNDKSVSLLEGQIGVDTKFVSGGDLNVLRFGGKVHGIKLAEKMPFILSPFAYVNVSKAPLEYKGVLTGVDISVQLSKAPFSCSLNGQIEYSNNDLIETIIKREKEQGSFSLGVSLWF